MTSTPIRSMIGNGLPDESELDADRNRAMVNPDLGSTTVSGSINAG